MAILRDNSVKTFLSLCLLNLFLFVQFLVVSEQLAKNIHREGEPELRCAVSHWSLNAHAEIVSTDVIIFAPVFHLVGEKTTPVHFVVCDYLFKPGRGPPILYT